MAHPAVPRTAGRHRHETVRRHRAPLLSLSTDRGRAALLTAALGAALVAGVAGGTAAAAADRDETTSDAAIGAATGMTEDDDAVAAATGMTGDDAARRAATGMGGDDAARQAAASRVAAGNPTPARFATGTGVTARKKTKPAVRTAEVVRDWANPNPAGRVTSCYGQRWGRLHAGVDLAGPAGSPIHAAGTGVVVRAGVAEGYGNAVLIDHGDGYLTHYGHMATIEVHVGQRVTVGTEIGTEGSTGHSTGPHLHFEVHQGHYKNPIEPTRWMHEHGVDITGC